MGIELDHHAWLSDPRKIQNGEMLSVNLPDAYGRLLTHHDPRLAAINGERRLRAICSNKGNTLSSPGN